MKKIPTLFKRAYENNRVIRILPIVTPGMEWVLAGEGMATVMVDGDCCAIIDGVFYKRYDAKNGKPVPEGAIKCQDEPDPITGHLPCWVRVDEKDPADKWFVEAYKNYMNTLKIDASTCENQFAFVYGVPANATYEAIGKHFQGNPYCLKCDILERHGTRPIYLERSFAGIKKYLTENYIEGIVFWKDGEPKCKIKRSDFGFEWNEK